MPGSIAGKYAFFEEFKTAMKEEVEEKTEDIIADMPKLADYQKNLIINVGYYNSYKALRTARNIPNSTQR